MPDPKAQTATLCSLHGEGYAGIAAWCGREVQYNGVFYTDDECEAGQLVRVQADDDLAVFSGVVYDGGGSGRLTFEVLIADVRIDDGVAHFTARGDPYAEASL